MTDINIQQSDSYCKYCRQPLQLSSDSDQGFHASCHDVLTKYNVKINYYNKFKLPSDQLEFLVLFESLVYAKDKEKLNKLGNLHIYDVKKHVPSDIKDDIFLLIKKKNLVFLYFSNSDLYLIPRSLSDLESITEIRLNAIQYFGEDSFPIFPQIYKNLLLLIVICCISLLELDFYIG